MNTNEYEDKCTKLFNIRLPIATVKMSILDQLEFGDALWLPFLKINHIRYHWLRNFNYIQKIIGNEKYI